LAHEAFHAYLENYLTGRDGRAAGIPRWLNEGLAQVFEAGRLEADTLRIDAPGEKLLAALKTDLRRDKPLPLAELLSAEQDLFLVSHPGGARSSNRHYLYAWALTYYLTFGPVGLDAAALDELSRTDRTPVERLQKILGHVDLDEFESRWHADMLRLRSNGEWPEP
jgi:hypothetical protein